MIFVTRRLAIISTDQNKNPLDVRIYVPEQEENGWVCRYEIDWPKKPRTSSSYGIDGVQALVTAMQKIALELYHSSYHQSGSLIFDKQGNGYGFPITKNGRNLLVGDDAIFDGD